MRESFVFHDKYIRGVPAELLGEFCTFIVKYGLYGEEPEFTDWRDQKIWSDIKDRIDADTENYNSVTLKKRLGFALTHFKAGKASQEEVMLLKENGFNFRKGDFSACIEDGGSADSMPMNEHKNDFMDMNEHKKHKSMDFMDPKNNTDTDTRCVFVSDSVPVPESVVVVESVGNEACASAETTADFSTDSPQKKEAKGKEPSIDDVKSYIEEKDLNVNEDDFWDYYSGSPGKDWKRMLLAWSRRERNPEARKSNNAARYDFARKGG